MDVPASSTNYTSSGDAGFGYGYGLNDIPAKTVTLQNSSDLKFEVADAESNLKESILNQTIAQGHEFRSLQKQAFDAEKEALKSGFKSELEVLKSERRIEEKITRESDQIKGQMAAFRLDVDRQFTDIKLREDASQIDTLKSQLADSKSAASTAEIMNALTQIGAKVGAVIAI